MNLSNFQLENARVVELDIPRCEDSVEAAQIKFDELCHRIVQQFQVMKPKQSISSNSKKRKRPGRSTYNSWVKQICYEVILVMLYEDQVGLFNRRIRKYSRHAASEKNKINIFQTGIIAIFAHDKKIMGPRDRERFGKELMYAFRHYIPVEFLDGFIRQCSSSNLSIARRLKNSDLEKQFENWIVGERSREEDQSEFEGLSLEEWRGSYPKHIEERVEKSREAVMRKYKRRLSVVAVRNDVNLGPKDDDDTDKWD